MAKRTNISGIKGFTLIETLVAIAILGMVIVGPLTLAIKSIGSAAISQNQITASYLAQEAIEYIKNHRDNNFLQGTGWLDGLDDCLGSNGCYIDVFDIGNEINGCIINCPKIRYDSGNKQYNYIDGEETVFIRTVKIAKINIDGDEDEAEIKVKVEWQEKFGEKSFILQDNIFNWKKYE